MTPSQPRRPDAPRTVRPQILADVSGRTDLLTVSQFAHRVSSTAVDVNAMHQQGYFRAAVEGGRGRGKMRLYAPEQVEPYKAMKKGQLAQSLSQVIDRVPFSGEQAQMAFKAFREGKTLEQLVLDHGIHPDLALAMMQAWTRLIKGIFVSAETLALVEAMPLDGPIPISNEADLLEVLRLAAESATCPTCRKGQKFACRKCITQAVYQARQEEREKAATGVSAQPPEFPEALARAEDPTDR